MQVKAVESMESGNAVVRTIDGETIHVNPDAVCFVMPRDGSVRTMDGSWLYLDAESCRKLAAELDG